MTTGRRRDDLDPTARLITTLTAYLADTSPDLNPTTLLERYLANRDGAHFETFGNNPRDRITSDDLIAVTMLSIPISLNTRSGIPPSTAVELEDRSEEIRELLDPLPIREDLHVLDGSKFEKLIGADAAPANKLWRFLRGSRLRDKGLDQNEPRLVHGLPRVATAKLIVRKRPQLLPVIDSVTDQCLFANAPGSRWAAWWHALNRRQDLVKSLELARDEVDAAAHLSVLRVADIITWERDRYQRRRD